LLVEEPIEQPIACLAEIGTRGKDPPVDTGLDLALEEARVVELCPQEVSRTRPTARRARSPVGSNPRSRNSSRVSVVEVHPGQT
jgi:hypothetical protein